MNYKESSISGTSWVRANKITITNGYNEVPTIHFHEEEVAEVNGSVYRKELGAMTTEMTDGATTFPLINPMDGSVIGSATYQQLQVMMFSLYFALATKRDTPQ